MVSPRTESTVAVVPIRHTDSVASFTIGGRSVLDHTVRALRSVRQIGPIILALEGGEPGDCLAAIDDPDSLDLRVSPPSASRWLAMQSALALVEGQRVLIQEPDRPLVSVVGLEQVLLESRHHPVVVTASPVHSSIKRVVDGRIVSTVPRDLLRTAQSPWIFDRHVLEEALRAAIALGWPATHEMELVRHSDLPVHIATGDLFSVPVVSRADARFAEMALERIRPALPATVAAGV